MGLTLADMTDDSQPPQYGPPPGPGPYYGQQPPPPPQYGGQPYQMPPPYGYQQFARPVDPKAVRPRLWWIAVGWLVAVVCVAVGVGVFATGIVSTVANVAPTKVFAAGEQVTVTVDPAESPALYVTRGQLVHYECQISGGAKLANTPINQTVELNGRSWEEILVINAPSKGQYQITCTTQEKNPDTRFGVGRELTGAARGLVGSAVAFIVIPLVGILAAIVVTIVVLVRRGSHRKRLAAGG